MIDRETEIRVWQRVRGQDTTDGDLAQLIRLSRQQAEDFRQLDRELYRQERITLGLLTALYDISVGGTVTDGRTPSPGLSRGQRIRRCRERCRSMLQLYIRLENHERYGGLFTDLTRRQRAVCARLDQLAGNGQ